MKMKKLFWIPFLVLVFSCAIRLVNIVKEKENYNFNYTNNLETNDFSIVNSKLNNLLFKYNEKDTSIEIVEDEDENDIFTTLV